MASILHFLHTGHLQLSPHAHLPASQEQGLPCMLPPHVCVCGMTSETGKLTVHGSVVVTTGAGPQLRTASSGATTVLDIEITSQLTEHVGHVQSTHCAQC